MFLHDGSGLQLLVLTVLRFLGVWVVGDFLFILPFYCLLSFSSLFIFYFSVVSFLLLLVLP